MTDDNNEIKRLRFLLGEHALHGLGAGRLDELDMLLQRHPDVDGDEYESLAADLHLAQLDGPLDELPAGLLESMQEQAAEYIVPSPAPLRRPRAAGKPTGTPTEKRTSLAILSWAGWVLAAASLALATVLYTDNSPVPSAREDRATLMASAEDLIQADWTATEDELVKDLQIGGEVVWSDASGEGYMRFTGFPVNDPSTEQYQLWIFDKTRSADQPVDGGVFNVTSEGEVIVPIDAKIKVDEAFMFAITVERPGGVVVSEREHLVLLGQL